MHLPAHAIDTALLEDAARRGRCFKKKKKKKKKNHDLVVGLGITYFCCELFFFFLFFTEALAQTGKAISGH